MAEYSFKCGSRLKTSKKLDIILSSKLFKRERVPKKIQKWLTYFLFTNQKYSKFGIWGNGVF